VAEQKTSNNSCDSATALSFTERMLDIMIDDFHEKRQSKRRKEDGQLEFLLNQVKLAIRLPILSAKDVLMNAVDTIEKGEKI